MTNVANDIKSVTVYSPPAPLRVVEVWVLELRPLPHPVPAAVRMRRLLKTLLRGYAIRCVAVRGGDGEDASDE